MKSKITLKEETNHMISIDVIIGCYQFDYVALARGVLSSFFSKK